MVGLVGTMKLRRDLPEAKMPQEREAVKRQVAVTNRQLDALRSNMGSVQDYPRYLTPGDLDVP